MALDKLVQIYIKKIRPKVNEEYLYFSEQASLENAIMQATLAIDRDGKRYSHQRRLSRAVIDEAHRTIMNKAGSVVECKSFATLHKLIDRLVSNIDGIGPLYVYDTSVRIGAYLDLYPSKVYLHAGTKKGAKALGLDCRSEYLNLDELPSALQELAAHEIEDFLCIFKDELSGGKYSSDSTNYLEKSGYC